MYVKFKYRVYYDERTGYSVCQYKSSDLGKTVVCTGINLPTTKNMTYEFDVKKQETGKYAGSYNVLSFTEYVNQTEEDIINYLSCGLFPGISKKIAEKIYKRFGSDTVKILETDINRLLEVSGVGEKTISKIKQSYDEKKNNRLVAQLLTKYGVSINACGRIAKKYGAESLNVVHNMPYDLCQIKGITFPIADAIAKDNGISETSAMRIRAASDYILKEDMLTGNVCMPKISYALKLIDVLNTPYINKNNILEYVLDLIKNRDIYYNKRISIDGKNEFFYYPHTYRIEREIAAQIRSLLMQKKRNEYVNIDDLIKKYEKLFSIDLDPVQKLAVKMGVTEPLFIITGGPGTGKTTILKIIAHINQELNKSVDNNIFLSPTGRAAHRITESTGYPAKTIHSALGLGMIDNDDVFADNREILLEDMNVIVDEASMVDMFVMHHLICSIKNSSLGFIGDIDQLPSVRCGSILRDMIASKIIPCIQLSHIHRQSSDAHNICDNAKNIKNGVHKLNTGYDFEIIESSDLEDAEKELLSQAIHQIDLFGLDNVKVLCPFKKGYAGVYRMNTLMQNALNPPKKGLELSIPFDMSIRAGDPVMQLKNIEDVSNGDIGYVELISATEVVVKFGEKTYVTYTYQDAKEQLTLAYATTVHKSQGSEYDAVILCMTDKHGMMKRRNILYTGITRGKHKVTLIGTMSAFYDAIDNNMIEDRYSMLSELISRSAVIEKKETKKEETYTQMVLPIVV